MSNISEADIVPLDPIDHVRRRPGMYIGGTDQRALNLLIFTVIDELLFDNKLDANYQRANQFFVTLLKHNAVSISDNGSGLSVAVEDVGNMTISRLEVVMTRVSGTGFWYVINALSAQFIAEVKRDGFLWQQTYSEGKSTSEIIQIRPLENGEPTGTKITFTPDFSIFEPNEFSYMTLAKRFRELAYLVPGLILTLKDEREQPEGDEISFHAPNGLADFVAFLNRDYTTIHPPIHRREQVEAKKSYEESVTVNVEIAFQFVEQPQTLVLSYANTEATNEGGTHVDGLLEGIETVFNTVFIDQQLVKKQEDRLTIHELMPGLTAVVSILHPQIHYVSAGRCKIGNPEVRDAVSDVVVDAVDEFAQQHPADMQRLIDHLLVRKQERDQRRFGE